jgi:plastocyanin
MTANFSLMLASHAPRTKITRFARRPAPLISAIALFFFFFAFCVSRLAGAATVSVTVAPGGQHVFDPAIVNINAGDTVEWTWADSFHTVTSGSPCTQDSLFNSGFLNPGDKFSFTFTTAGTYDYFCIPHCSMGMVGTVNVAAATPTPTPSATPTPTVTPTPTATPTPTSTPTPTATATPTPTPTPSPTPTPTPMATSLNVSTRLEVGTGDQVLIGGIIITDTQSSGSAAFAATAGKRVLLRAIGPSLVNPPTNIPNALPDPVLELHAGDGSLITSNDNWVDSPDKAEIEATGAQPTNDLESAIIATLDPGAYTAIVKGANDVTGIGVVEAYDLDPNNGSLFSNIATRGLVQTGDNVLIAGFILGPDGTADAPILIRAIGPSLPSSQVPDPLADPVLDLYDSNGTRLESNDNWMDSPDKAAIEATGIPPTNDLESAIYDTLPTGAYTAIVSGKNSTTGVAVVEVYRLSQPPVTHAPNAH